MSSYRRYILINIIIVVCYFLFWVASSFVLHLPLWANIGAALVTLAAMTILFSRQHQHRD